MAKTILVDKDIEEGIRLIDSLKEANIPVNSALWVYLSEPERWRLLVASSLYDRQGPLKVYRKLVSVFREISPKLKIPVTDISIVSPKDGLIQGLRKLQGPNINLSGIRLRDTPVENSFIEDSYIYQIS